MRFLRALLDKQARHFETGGFWEVLFSVVRGHEVNEGLLVTGMLFPLILPATVPLWQVALGGAAAWGPGRSPG